MNIIKPLSLVGLFFLSQPSFAQYATSWDTSEPSINQISGARVPLGESGYYH